MLATCLQVIAATALSAVAMLFCVGLAGISSAGIYYDVSQDYCYDRGVVKNATNKICRVDPFEFCSAWTFGPQCLDENGKNVSIVLSAILSVLALIEFAIALSSACLICSCCSVKDNKVGHGLSPYLSTLHLYLTAYAHSGAARIF